MKEAGAMAKGGEMGEWSRRSDWETNVGKRKIWGDCKEAKRFGDIGKVSVAKA
jgi:hypothetical protein